MAAQWHFIQPKPGDKNREPVLGEFFATDAISNAAEALVRQGTLNSLDAGLGTMVRIRIYVPGEVGALNPGSAAAYFNDAWPHINAEVMAFVMRRNLTKLARFSRLR